jgi:ADP-ribosyltransferase exoenzyme
MPSQQQRAQYEEYAAEQVAMMESEQGLSDAAEVALAGIIYELLILYGSAQASKLTYEIFENGLQGFVKPFAMAVAARMLTRRVRRLMGNRDPRDWDALARQITRTVLSQVYDSAVRETAKLEEETRRDPYYRAKDDDVVSPDAAARAIARTIVTGVAEGMKMAVADRLGFDRRRWLTRLDSRVRHSHALLEGVTRKLGEPFETTTGAKLMHPGDRSAPPGEWINCRCSVVYLAPEDTVVGYEVEEPVAASVRNVATQAGVAWYKQPIGAPIVADDPVKARLTQAFLHEVPSHEEWDSDPSGMDSPTLAKWYEENPWDPHLMSYYMHGEAARINADLRSGRAQAGDPDIASLDEIIHEPERKTAREMTVYRGLPGKVFDEVKVGDVISDKAYLSTSLDPEIAAVRGDSDNRVLVIKVPAGSNALYIPGMLREDLEDETSASHDQVPEREMIFPRDARLKIVAIDGQHVFAEYIGPGMTADGYGKGMAAGIRGMIARIEKLEAR